MEIAYKYGEIKSIIEKYVDELEDDGYNRYLSWDNCQETFASPNPSKLHSLKLAFYLASWGMYRGSSGLLQKNHLIHQFPVDIFYTNEFNSLKCNSIREITKDKIDDVLSLGTKLSDHYKSINFVRGLNTPKPISTTDTLISKIILGTYTCIPAFHIL